MHLSPPRKMASIQAPFVQLRAAVFDCPSFLLLQLLYRFFIVPVLDFHSLPFWPQRSVRSVAITLRGRNTINPPPLSVSVLDSAVSKGLHCQSEGHTTVH